MFNMNEMKRCMDDILFPNINNFDKLKNIREDLIPNDFKTRDLIEVNDFVVYVATEYKDTHFETVIYNNDISPITIHYKDEFVDWNDSYTVFKTEGFDKLQAFRNHYVVVEFLKALDIKTKSKNK